MYLLMALVGLSALVPSSLGLALRLDPVLPTDDPFYTQPLNISAYHPGDIIATRAISTNLNGILGASVTAISVQAAYQYLFRTTDSLKNPVAAVTTVLVPHNAKPGYLLSYQTAYDSANINCGPGYFLQAGANNTDIVDIVMITAALNKGYVVVSADYEGLRGAFASGLQAGYATLDSVRAALSPTSTGLTGLSSTARYAMWGYSGGSLASEWAAELQPSYAPELNFQGVALGGLVGNVTNVVVTINGGAFAGLAFSGIQGSSNAYPSVADLVNLSFVSDARREQFTSIARGCLSQAVANGALQNLNSYFKSSINSILQDPVVRTKLIETGQMGQTGVPRMPMFIYKPVGDEVSPVADTDYVVNALCAKGATIEYRKNLFGEHNTEDILGSGKALAWIEDRLEGKPVAKSGCSTEVVLISSLGLDTLATFGLELFSLLQNILGGRLGPLLAV